MEFRERIGDFCIVYYGPHKKALELFKPFVDLSVKLNKLSVGIGDEFGNGFGPVTIEP
ncbi:MAG: hypothetical protein ACOYXR_00640 [Nitrospirota bacterium]